MEPIQIARIAHEINRAYCEAIGDISQKAWEDSPEWQIKSAIFGVMVKLDNPDTTPEQMHESWMAQKEKDGWKWGPNKDPELKLHPCMLPYEELPIEQRVKDHLFSKVIDLLK